MNSNRCRTYTGRSQNWLLVGLMSFTPLAAHAENDNSQPMTWRGCGITQQAFMRSCAKAYEKETGEQIIVSGGGAALGIRSTAGGSADMGGTCRYCMPGRFSNEQGVEVAIIAWDALVAVTHPSNQTESLTQKQLSGILRGDIKNWKEIGGSDQRIILVGRKGKDSGVGVMMRELILNDPEFNFSQDSILLRSSRPVELFLERTPGAIAITGVSSAKKRDLKILHVDGVAPTRENIASGRFPYYRPLYIAHSPNANPRTLAFIEWIQGKKGQAVIADQGTVTLAMGLNLLSSFKHWGKGNNITNRERLMKLAQGR